MTIEEVRLKQSNDNTDPSTLAGAFDASISNKPTDIVGPDDEIEIKDVMDLDPHGGDTAFCEKNKIQYPTEIFLNALVREGICVSDPNDLHTKNLVSYYFDTIDRALNHMRISLRMRHEETPVAVNSDNHLPDYGFQPTEPDLSFKIPLTQQGDNSRRLEYETPTKFRAQKENQGGFKFVMTFQHLVDKYVSRILEENGPAKAVAWAKQVHKLFGFDWNKFREHFSINCKRTQPYARVFTLVDEEGNIQRDNNGKVLLHKDDADWREQKIKGLHYKAIVFQFCLDTNRYFTETEKDGSVKIARDHEVEFELQTKTCDYSRNAIKSDDGVTYEEAWVAARYLKDLVYKTMAEHNVEKHKYSGLSKQERGFLYIDQHNANNPENRVVITDKLTIRGRNDLHTTDSLNYDQMVATVPALEHAHKELGKTASRDRHHRKTV